MKANHALLVAVAAILSASAHAHPPATAKQKLASVQYRVGTWQCAHTVGAFSGTYRTTYTNALGGLWLKQTYDFPPTDSAGRSSPSAQAECLIGFDERRQAWGRFFAMSDGAY